MEPWQTATRADGPALARFVRRVLTDRAIGGKILRTFDPALEKRLYRWERGASPDLGTVDRTAVSLGYHLSELPPEVWA